MKNYRETLTQHVRDSISDKDQAERTSAGKLTRLFKSVSSLVESQSDLHAIPLISTYPYNDDLKLHGVSVHLKNGDIVELAIEEQKRAKKGNSATHVLIGIIAQVDESDKDTNAGKILHEQTVLTFDGQSVMLINSINSITENWKQTDPHIERDLDNDITYLKMIIESAAKKISPGSAVKG